MNVTFLQSKIPLTKQFTKTQAGVEKTSYPHAARFTSHAEPVADIAMFATALRTHAALGHCLLKGNVTTPLHNRSRKAATSADAATRWICLDIDGLPARVTVPAFLVAMGLDHVSYVLQYSASYGIESRALRAHVFMLLAEPWLPAELKRWLIARNYQVPVLARALTLTATHLALHYGLDITTCQNDKLLYIAPPLLHGLPDPLTPEARITTVIKTHATLEIDRHTVPDHDTNRAHTNNIINTLRKKANLPERTFKFITAGEYHILARPEAALVSAIKTDRGFVYFNLNGGDSWGYWHPQNNPELIHNFKGEPTYYTRELLPDYWAALHPDEGPTSSDDPNHPDDPDQIVYLAFLDRNTSSYWRGSWRPATRLLDLYMARNETQLRHYMKQHGVPVGDFIPEWTLIYDPLGTVVVDEAAQVINTFMPSPYMQATPVPRSGPPKTIHKIIHHALGSDAALVTRFINWLAFILQQRTRTTTAWVLHGTTGTGKGMMVARVLEPIFGNRSVTSITQHSLDTEFNTYLAESLIVFVDEMEHGALKGTSSSIMAKLKNYITEPKVMRNEKYQRAFAAPNHANFIFASNRPDPIHIDREDRRFNVARYQPARLPISDAEIKRIDGELQHFHDYLHFLVVDTKAVRTVVKNDDATDMMAGSETSVDTAVHALTTGDWQFFLDQLPTDERYREDRMGALRVEDYQRVLSTLAERTHPDTGRCNILRDELRTLFEYLCGNIPTTPIKFVTMLKHHRLKIHGIRVGNDTPRGIYVTWSDPQLVTTMKLLKPIPPIASNAHLKVIK